jgi:hypothetical protein
VSPDHGPVVGFSLVRIRGANLSAGEETCFFFDLLSCKVSVHFGANAAFVIFDSPTAVLVLSPPNPPGTVDVTATVDGQTSTTSPADHFAYVELRLRRRPHRHHHR